MDSTPSFPDAERANQAHHWVGRSQQAGAETDLLGNNNGKGGLAVSLTVARAGILWPLPKRGFAMTPDVWLWTKRVFAGARELSKREQLRFLDEACGDDSELRAEVESLLAADTGPRRGEQSDMTKGKP